MAIVDEEDFITDHIEINQPIVEGFEYRNQVFKRPIQQNDLLQDASFVSRNHGISLNFKGGNVFVFRKGNDLGVNGWVSRSNILPYQDHLILYHEQYETNVNRWIVLNNLSVSRKSYTGLPFGWKSVLVSIKDSTTIENELIDPNLIVKDERVTINLTNGLRVGNQEWLLDAPPYLSISAPSRSTVIINNVPMFSLLEGSDNIDMACLKLNESKTYTISVGNYNKTILLKNNHDNEIDNQNFDPKITQSNKGTLRIAGTYIYDDLKKFAPPYKLERGRIILSADGREVQKIIPKDVQAPPFDLNRSYQKIGILFADEKDITLRPIDLFFEYLTIRESGNWSAFIKGLKWCFGDKNLGLIAYKVRQKLSQLGFVEFTCEGDSNRYFWKVIPTTVSVLPCADALVCLTGARTRQLVAKWRNMGEGKVRFIWSYPKSEFEPLSIYILARSTHLLEEYLNSLKVNFNWGEDYFAFDLVKCLPTLSSMIKACPEWSEPPKGTWKSKGWDPFQHRWFEARQSNLKLYSNDYGNYFCLFYNDCNIPIKVDRDVGKLYLACLNKIEVFSYRNYILKVRREYYLPELYERVLVSCCGQCPEEEGIYRFYKNVPLEVALSVTFKLGFELKL
jgi:hypothetical protein